MTIRTDDDMTTESKHVVEDTTLDEELVPAANDVFSLYDEEEA